MSAELPGGWDWFRLDEVVEQDAPIIYGIIQPGPDTPGGVPYVRPTEIENDEIRLNLLRRTTPEIARKYKRASLRASDVLLSIVGTIGKVAVVPQELEGGNITQSSARLRPARGRIEPQYLAWLLRSPAARREYDRVRLGTGVPRLNLAQVREQIIPVAPFDQQRRIVEKIEALTAKSRRAKEALDAIPPLLERFRQSVLAAAFRGDLTKDWREQHPDVEPADQRLARIRQERRARWEQAELEKLRAKGKAPKNGDWKIKYVEPDPVDADGLPELPAGWCWARAEQVCDFITKGTTPAKDDMMAGHGDVPYIKVYNLTFDGLLDFSVDPTFVSRLTHVGALARSRVLPGDVLMNIVGPPLGKVSIVPATHPEWNMNQAIATFRPVPGLHPEVLAWHLLREWTVAIARASAKATAGQFNLTLEICRSLPVPILPAAEQELLRLRVAAAWQTAGRVREAAGVAAENCDRLDQSVLAKAFRGELVESTDH